MITDKALAAIARQAANDQIAAFGSSYALRLQILANKADCNAIVNHPYGLEAYDGHIELITCEVDYNASMDYRGLQS